VGSLIRTQHWIYPKVNVIKGILCPALSMIQV
jgi:hypothetical protein